MRRTRGFTLIELSLVLSLTALLVPAVFLAWRSLEAEMTRAQRTLDAAEVVRTVGEELRLDARSGRLAPGAVEFERRDACGPVRYALTSAGALLRTAPAACGGEKALASGVSGLRRVPGGVELDLRLEVRPDLVETQTLFFAVEGGP